MTVGFSSEEIAERLCTDTDLAKLDVAALQFVGRSISVFLTFNILLCTVYLCWT